MSTIINVTIVEDNLPLAELLKEVLEEDGFYVCHVDTVSVQIFLALCPEPPDVLVCDMNLPGGSGTDLCREVLKRFPKCSPVLMSGDPEPLPCDFSVTVLRKPFTLLEFRHLVGELTKHDRIDRSPGQSSLAG